MQRKARTAGILIHQQRGSEVQQVGNAQDQQPYRLQAIRRGLHTAGEVFVSTIKHWRLT